IAGAPPRPAPASPMSRFSKPVSGRRWHLRRPRSCGSGGERSAMSSKSKELDQRIQHELARKGFDPGPIDGVWGRKTEKAVRAYQLANGLLADGIVGPKTSAALFGQALKPAPSDEPAIPWFQEARRLIGVSEVVGPGNNPTIIDWAKGSGIDYRSDDTPWCGLFVGHCVSTTLEEEKLPGNPLGARNWMKFGAPC